MWHFGVITANQGPDHTTIARFRQTHGDRTRPSSSRSAAALCGGRPGEGGNRARWTARRSRPTRRWRRIGTVETITGGGLANADRGPGTDAAEDRQYGLERWRRPNCPRAGGIGRSRLLGLQRARSG